MEAAGAVRRLSLWSTNINEKFFNGDRLAAVASFRDTRVARRDLLGYEAGANKVDLHDKIATLIE